MTNRTRNLEHFRKQELICLCPFRSKTPADVLNYRPSCCPKNFDKSQWLQDSLQLFPMSTCQLPSQPTTLMPPGMKKSETAANLKVSHLYNRCSCIFVEDFLKRLCKFCANTSKRVQVDNNAALRVCLLVFRIPTIGV
jgi:hypothetical protein